jgi:hypothetical protein
MRIVLPLEKKKYLYDLRRQMESWFSFGEARFTGVVLGNFFYITHHAGFEWNRRITNEKTRAIGFVTRHSEGCEVKTVILRGYLDPVSLAWMYLLWLGVLWLGGISGPTIYMSAVGITLVTGVISAVQCWFTERGRESLDELLSLLYNPEILWDDPEE